MQPSQPFGRSVEGGSLEGSRGGADGIGGPPGDDVQFRQLRPASGDALDVPVGWSLVHRPKQPPLGAGGVPESQSMRPSTRFRAGPSPHCSTCTRTGRPFGLAGVQEASAASKSRRSDRSDVPLSPEAHSRFRAATARAPAAAPSIGRRFQLVGEGVVGPVGGRHPVGQHALGRQHPGGRAVQVPATDGGEILVHGLAVERVGELDRNAGLAGSNGRTPWPADSSRASIGSRRSPRPAGHVQRHLLVDHGQGRGQVAGGDGKLARRAVTAEARDRGAGSSPSGACRSAAVSSGSRVRTQIG